MVYLYSTPDRRVRFLSHDDRPAPPPFALVASFEEKEASRAWELLYELGGQASDA